MERGVFRRWPNYSNRFAGRHGAAWKVDVAVPGQAGSAAQAVIRLAADVREKIVSSKRISPGRLVVPLVAEASDGRAS